MNSRTNNWSGFNHYYQNKLDPMVVGLGQNTERSSMACFEFCGAALRGVTCPNDMDPGKRCTTDSIAGVRTGLGT